MINLNIVLDNIDIGGAQKLMLDVASELDKSIFNVRVIVLYKNYGLNLLDCTADMKIEFLDFKDNINIPARCLHLSSFIMDCDIVLFSGLDSSVYLSLIRFFIRDNRAFVNVVHGVDGYFIDDEYLKLQYGKLSKIIIFKEKYLLSIFLKFVDNFIVMCNSLTDYLVNIRKISHSKIKRIYFGTKFSEITVYDDKSLSILRKLYGISDDDFVICYSGRLTFAKGLENIVELFSKLSVSFDNIKLMLCGDGELKGYLSDEVKKYNLGNSVIITGFTLNTNKFIQMSDLYILPSKSESVNLGVQSAMYLGKIVLASDAGGLVDIIENGINGFLFKTGDLLEFYNKMEMIIRNRFSFSELKENAVSSVLKKFDLGRNIRCIESELIRIYNNKH